VIAADDLHFGAERVSHGACVAVGTVATLRMYDWLLSRDRLSIDPARAPGVTLAAKEDEIRRLFGPGEIADRAIVETRLKHIEGPAMAARLTLLQKVWPLLSARLRGRLWTADRMADHLARAGAPSSGAEIGVDEGYLYRSIMKARFLRSRYTVLDLLDECGLLHKAALAASGAASVRRVGT